MKGKYRRRRDARIRRANEWVRNIPETEMSRMVYGIGLPYTANYNGTVLNPACAG